MGLLFMDRGSFNSFCKFVYCSSRDIGCFGDYIMKGFRDFSSMAYFVIPCCERQFGYVLKASILIKSKCMEQADAKV
jgi:hypothetical protein